MLADEQDGIRYWKEETLCRFLVIPDAVGSGPAIYQMATYLGAFPFPSLAPCILTIEAMLLTIVLMTERYSKVLQRGNRDKNRRDLLFRSLAVYDRRMSNAQSDTGRQESKDPEEKEKNAEKAVETARNLVPGFSVDGPGNDEDDEDDDELVLAALGTLDAMEAFKDDRQIDIKIQDAQIPIDNFRRLLMFLLLIAPLSPQENLSKHTQRLTESRLRGLRKVADNILWAFSPETYAGIPYSIFNTIIPISLPFLFDGLSPLFEHFLFRKDIDLSRRRHSSSVETCSHMPLSPTVHGPLEPLLSQEGEILDDDILNQLSFFIKGSNLFRKLRLLYSGGDAGFSLGSFKQKVLNWRAPCILLVAGTRLSADPRDSRERAFADTLPPKRFPDGATGNSKAGKVLFGAYLNVPWRETHKEAIGDSETLLFQLEPVHEVFHASNINRDYVTLDKTGISFGCPPSGPKISGISSYSALGPVSLKLDSSLEFGVFTHDRAGGGSIHTSQSRRYDWQDRFEVQSLEVWGCGGDEEAERQRAAWAFEEREAAARQRVNFGKNVEADRALLEMAGLLLGSQGSGGSMG